MSKAKAVKDAAKAAKTKYDTLSYLLGQYGVNNIDANTFWNQMKQNGWGQDDIDQWCAEYYRREQEKEDEREKANGTTGATASRYARGADFKEQSADRQGEQDRQGREGRAQVSQDNEEQAERSRSLRLPSDAELHAEAKRRYERDSLTHPNHRPLANGAEPYGHWLAGLMGEREFARLFDRQMNMELLPSGDNHIDFSLPFMSRDGVVRNQIVDLKCNTFGGDSECMLVEVAELRPQTLYVLANYDGISTILRGWMIGSVVAGYPQRRMRGRDILNHAVPIAELKPMDILLRLYRPLDLG